MKLKLQQLFFSKGPIQYDPLPGTEILDKANTLVTKAKIMKREVDSWIIPEEIDFLGCSDNYVLEKIELLIQGLQWAKRRIKEVSKSQREGKK